MKKYQRDLINSSGSQNELKDLNAHNFTRTSYIVKECTEVAFVLLCVQSHPETTNANNKTKAATTTRTTKEGFLCVLCKTNNLWGEIKPNFSYSYH